MGPNKTRVELSIRVNCAGARGQAGTLVKNGSNDRLGGSVGGMVTEPYSWCLTIEVRKISSEAEREGRREDGVGGNDCEII